MFRLLVALPSALFFAVFALTACGGGGGGRGGGGTDSPTPTPAPTPAPDPDPEPSARFSAEILEGDYVFSSIGFEPFEGVFHTIGHFTADGQGGTSDFVIYPIDEDQALIMSTEPGLVAVVTVRRQTSGTISTSTVVGPHIFTSFGANLDAAVSSLSRVVLEADGTISEGRITLNSRAGQLDDAPLTSTFAVNALGVGEVAVA